MAETQNIVKDYLKVKYITLEAAVCSLGPELVNEIKPLNEIVNTSISSVSSACSTTSSRLERPTSPHEVFMGKLLEQKIFPPIPPTNSQSVRLKLQEVTQTNETGKIFQLMLYSQIAAHWSENDNFKTLPGNKGSVLVVFKCANLKTTRKGDVQFTLTHLNISLGARIWVKQYFTSLQEARSPVYIYQPLLEAISQGARRHVNIYAVVHSIIKPPRETRTGKFYSMILVVDPSCYNKTHEKINDIVLHILASTLADFPAIYEGDVVRLHRALIQDSLQNNKLDIRIFSEKDMVVFPLDERKEPHSAAAHYAITVEDMKTVQRLLPWSLKYIKTNQQGMNQASGPVQARRNDNVVTLAEINSNEDFHLPCRLVAMFDEDEGVALWVEDGTRCPLLTSSIVTDYNSQETDMVEGNVYQIRIRSHKEKILCKEPLEPGKSLLFLREVHPTIMAKTDEGNIIQFEVMGHVEILPPTPVTRYVKSLTQRLGKMRSNNPSDIQMPPPTVEMVQPPREIQACLQVPLHIRSPERSPLELAAPVAIENVSSPQRSPPTQPSPKIVAEPSTEDSPGRRISHTGFHQGDLIPSSGESATERAMLEMPIPEIVTLPPPSSIVLADLRRENQRLQKLVLEEDGSQLPAIRPIDIAPLEEASFSQVIASTQKSPPLVALQEAENSQNELEESSEEMPNGQRLPSSPSGMESPSQINRTHSQSESPHPVFRAVEEVLEIRTTLERDDDASNQLNMSINNLESSPNQQRRVTRSSRVTQQLAVEVSSCLRMSDRKRRNSPSKEETNTSPVTKIRRREPSSSSSSSNESVMEVNPDGNSQESDDENASVVLLPLSSQPNLELFFRRVEESVPNEYLTSLAEADSILPGDRFRVTTQIAALSGTNDPQSGLMESLIVAICSECRHLWQYHHFKDSVSQRVRRTYRWKPPVQGNKETLHDEAVMNFLGCEQEDHEATMKFLREDPSPDLKAYDYDENEFMDRSYFYICPLCSQRGLPDSLIVLDPGFFFVLHLKDANRESESDQPESETCLHVMATGVHAEYLLGTKADHVLRSPVIWEKAEARLSQMLQHGRNKKSLTLSIRRSPISPKEFCIEHTYLVYGARHVLPWF